MRPTGCAFKVDRSAKTFLITYLRQKIEVHKLRVSVASRDVCTVHLARRHGNLVSTALLSLVVFFWWEALEGPFTKLAG
eukprot:1153816-Pelagomonas_calceolata.AAC.9